MDIDKNLIASANAANPYVDITPYELEIGFPFVSYDGFFPQPNEILIYAAPASTFVDKEKVIGHTGRTAGVSFRVAKGVSLRTGGFGGQPIRKNIRDFKDGDLLITNKRILFTGKDDRFEILISKLSTIKLLDSNSFVLQSGKTSKNVYLNSVLLDYAVGFINYVVTESASNTNLYDVIRNHQGQITREQLDLCEEIRQDAARASLVATKKGKKKHNHFWGIILCVMFFMILIGLLTSEGQKLRASSTAPSSSQSAYDELELLTLENHPLIYSDFSSAQNFYALAGDKRVKVVSSDEYSALQRKIKEPSNDEVLLYLVGLPQNDNFIGELHINLFKPDFITSAEEVMALAASYLPPEFLTCYRKDSSYQHGNGDVTIYVYSCRLNEKGIEVHNNEHHEYSAYYSVKITHYNETDLWKIKTDYSAYGGQSLEWINNYSTPWDVDLNTYMEE